MDRRTKTPPRIITIRVELVPGVHYDSTEHDPERTLNVHGYLGTRNGW
jgi:hypothetical protein